MKKRVLEILDNTTQLIDGYYQFGLLWKENAKLPNNRWLAEKQFYQLNDKLSKNAQLNQMYEETLEKDLLNGYVTKVEPDTEDLDSIASFPPHHPVTNENKPGKVRRVANT